MARSWMVPVLCCLVAALHFQAAAAAIDGAVAHTNLGLALPDRAPPTVLVSDRDVIEDYSYSLSDAYVDDEYVMELERQELEDIQHMVAETKRQQQKQDEELAATVGQAAAPTAAASLTGLQRVPVPFELSAAQPVMAMASTLSREVRNAVEQAQAMAAQLLKNQGAMKVLTGGAYNPEQRQQEAAPVKVIELAKSASLGSDSDDGIQIDVTVTTERTGPTFMLPSILPSSMPAMFGFGGQSNSESSKQVELAAEIAQSVIESALANQAGGKGGDQELILNMTLEDAAPQSAQKLVAAAAAAAASAAASAALNKQPWDTLELQMEVVETTRPFFRSGRFCVVAMMLLSVQLLLCLAVAMLWTREEEEDEEDCDLEQVDLKRQKQQGEWASLAEEGRGLYEKLLSYT